MLATSWQSLGLILNCQHKSIHAVNLRHYVLPKYLATVTNGRDHISEQPAHWLPLKIILNNCVWKTVSQKTCWGKAHTNLVSHTSWDLIACNCCLPKALFSLQRLIKRAAIHESFFASICSSHQKLWPVSCCNFDHGAQKSWEYRESQVIPMRILNDWRQPAPCVLPTVSMSISSLEQRTLYHSISRSCQCLHAESWPGCRADKIVCSSANGKQHNVHNIRQIKSYMTSMGLPLDFLMVGRAKVLETCWMLLDLCQHYPTQTHRVAVGIVRLFTA